MQIGNKILELRKQNNLSQEQLAEKMKVARQTISKWELGETSPDLEQSRQLSQIFNVSLDDLTNNDIKNILVNKANKSEKVMKTIINILKIILLAIIIVIVILLFDIFCKEYFNVKPVSAGQSIECIIDGNKYIYEATYKFDEPNKIFSFNTDDRELNVDYKNYDNINFLMEDIKRDVTNRGGTCGIEH